MVGSKSAEVVEIEEWDRGRSGEGEVHAKEKEAMAPGRGVGSGGVDRSVCLLAKGVVVVVDVEQSVSLFLSFLFLLFWLTELVLGYDEEAIRKRTYFPLPGADDIVVEVDAIGHAKEEEVEEVEEEEDGLGLCIDPSVGRDEEVETSIGRVAVEDGFGAEELLLAEGGLEEVALSRRSEEDEEGTVGVAVVEVVLAGSVSMSRGMECE